MFGADFSSSGATWLELQHNGMMKWPATAPKNPENNCQPLLR
jgi:hypothetical protein